MKEEIITGIQKDEHHDRIDSYGYFNLNENYWKKCFLYVFVGIYRFFDSIWLLFRVFSNKRVRINIQLRTIRQQPILLPGETTHKEYNSSE